MNELARSHENSVSVIIPAYNRLHTLKTAVSSVLQQTHPAMEIIVVDDGSSDDTARWLKQQTHPVRSISQENHGVSHARNRGIEAAKGTWIALLDSDDHWHRDKLFKQIQLLNCTADARFCHCNELWFRNGKRINQKLKHRKRGGYIFEHCLPLCVISPSASVIHKDVFSTHGVFDESLPACEDYDLWLRITSKENVAFIDEPLLIKTGGHADQLSQKYPIMDMFRLQSLNKLLHSRSLNSLQYSQTRQMFMKKLKIVHKGAIKHRNSAVLDELAERYMDAESMHVLSSD